MRNLLSIDARAGKAVYLGYELSLTASEFRVFAALYERGGLPRQEDTWSEGDGSLGNVSLYIHHINVKAKRIGGRNIIRNSGHEYRFVEDI